MELTSQKPEMFFFPFFGGGHQIPMIDMARFFASHGANSTILTTPTNALSFQSSICRDQQLGLPVTIHVLHSTTPLLEEGMSATPFVDTSGLLEPFSLLLQTNPPDCVVVDMFHRWAAGLIDELGIPRITFNGSCCFAPCTFDIFNKYKPHENMGSDYEPFVLPNLPDRIEMTRSQVPLYFRSAGGGMHQDRMRQSEEKSFGVLVNSFYELEPAYVEYIRKEMGKRAWVVGPVSLCNTNAQDKAERGKKTSIDESDCLSWLDSKKPDSVLYISFGSLARLAPEQLLEIAHGLEDLDHPFIWAIGKSLNEDNWVLGEFERKMADSRKGLVIRGWSPQLLILEHKATGGLLTHCGWNSTIEAVSAGVPMITWPMSAEQFSNEKLITDVLKIGVRAGSMDWMSWNMEPKMSVKREKVKEVVESLMGCGEEAEERRMRAKELKEKAKRAVEVGGTSYNDADALVEELRTRRKSNLDA